MQTFLIANLQDTQKFIIDVEDQQTARHWIINRLDVSKMWVIIPHNRKENKNEIQRLYNKSKSKK